MIYYFETVAAHNFFELFAFAGLKSKKLTTFLFYVLLNEARDRETILELEQISFTEIQMMVSLYVRTVDIRPLLIDGGIGYYDWYDHLPDPPRRMIFICIRNDMSEELQLQVFAHEVVHIFHFKNLISFSNEDETDRIAALWVTKYHAEFKELFLATLEL